MAEYIEREAAKRALAESGVVPKYRADNRPVTDAIIDAIHAADVVPVSELLALRDALYENDQITMRGLARLNMLIAKYGGYDHG